MQMSFFGLTVKELFCICIQSLLPAPSPHAFIHSSGSVNIPFSSIIDVFTLYIAPFALPLFYIIIHILVVVNLFLPYNVFFLQISHKKRKYDKNTFVVSDCQKTENREHGELSDGISPLTKKTRFRGRAVQKPLPGRAGAAIRASKNRCVSILTHLLLQTKAPKASFRFEACRFYRHALSF